MRTIKLNAVILGLTLIAAPAGGQVRAGGHALYKSQAFDGTLGIGARAEVDLNFLRQGLVIAGLYERLFPGCEDCSASEAGAQLLLVPRGPLYLGLGANYRLNSEDDSVFAPDGVQDWNFSFVAGLRLLNMPIIVPFFEFRQQFASQTLNEQTFALGVFLSPVGRRSPPRRPFAR